MDRLELVGLIEAQKSKLSPQARELWDEFDTLIYPPDADRKKLFTRQEHDVIHRIGRLPRSDKRVLNPLRELRMGLYESNQAIQFFARVRIMFVFDPRKAEEQHRDRAKLNLESIHTRRQIPGK